MKKLPLLLLLSAGPALADDAAMLRCRAIQDIAARAACYDAIPLEQAAAFGVQRKPEAKEAQLQSIDSHIVGRFEGWEAGKQIKLANGQVWRIDDGSDYVMDVTDPKVKVRRGMLGAIFLDIDGAQRSPKVRRVQ